MATTTLYGIKNCDTVKKARRWLEQHGIEYLFHDFRADGLSPETFALWLEQVGAATLINKRSTTWKQLAEKDRTQVVEGDAASIALQQPTLIKRPVLQYRKQVIVGFSDKIYRELMLIE